MTGVALVADLQGLKSMAAAINQFASLNRRALLDDLGGAMESQTQRRISQDKKSPAGVPWPAWSPRYAKTRHANQSLLVSGGNPGLLTSITHNVLSEDKVEVGSNLIYAATHQFGDKKRKIPKRPYLGISPRDGDELERISADFIARNTPRSLQ